MRLISKDNVIRMRLPFPNMKSGLAVRTHMYIARNSETDCVKVQTYKPTLEQSRYIKNYIVAEVSDTEPFKSMSLVDLDKLFQIRNVVIPEDLLTSPDSIGNVLSERIDDELLKELYSTVKINADDLVKLNYKIQKLS